MASTIDVAHRTARAGPSNVAKKPSPAVSTSTPRNRAICPRTTAAFAGEGPALIDVVVDPGGYADQLKALRG